MRFFITADWALPWLFVREGFLAIGRVRWHLCFLDDHRFDPPLTSFHGNRWPRLLSARPMKIGA